MDLEELLAKLDSGASARKAAERALLSQAEEDLQSAQAQVVPLEAGVVPERVEADARLEAEVDERDGHDARLVIRAEDEKVVEEPRDPRLLGRGDGEAERAPDQILAHEIRWREQHARYPERLATRALVGVSAPVVVRNLAFLGLACGRVAAAEPKGK